MPLQSGAATPIHPATLRHPLRRLPTPVPTREPRSPLPPRSDQEEESPAGFLPQLTTGMRLWLCLLAVGATLAIAVQSRPNAHPDEVAHLDAFRYFEDHWWPPDLGSEEVGYTAFGWSRVYSQEIGYVLLGRASGALQQVLGGHVEPFMVYRLLNVALFAAVLLGLLFVRGRVLDPTPLGLVVLCLPQVHYVFAYANGDGFSIACATALLLLSIRLADRPLEKWNPLSIAALALTAGLVVTSKLPYLAALVLPGWLLLMRLAPALWRRRGSRIRWLAPRLAVLACVIVVVAAPLQVIWPSTQGDDFETAVVAMQDERALTGFKPSAPSHPVLRLDQKGMTAANLLMHTPWLDRTARSFYGAYGYMDVWSPDWLYRLAALAALLCVALTGWTTLTRWKTLSWSLRGALLLAPCVLLVNLGASVYFSLTVVSQPQGRYLFPSLFCIALLLVGTLHVEGRFARATRAGVFVVMQALCLFGLLALAANDGYGPGSHLG